MIPIDFIHNRNLVQLNKLSKLIYPCEHELEKKVFFFRTRVGFHSCCRRQWLPTDENLAALERSPKLTFFLLCWGRISTIKKLNYKSGPFEKGQLASAEMTAIFHHNWTIECFGCLFRCATFSNRDEPKASHTGHHKISLIEQVVFLESFHCWWWNWDDCFTHLISDWTKTGNVYTIKHIMN